MKKSSAQIDSTTSRTERARATRRQVALRRAALRALFGLEIDETERESIAAEAVADHVATFVSDTGIEADHVGLLARRKASARGYQGPGLDETLQSENGRAEETQKHLVEARARAAQVSALVRFDVQRAIEILRAASREDPESRPLYRDAEIYLLHLREFSEPRTQEWRDSLSQLRKTLDAALVERARLTLEEIAAAQHERIAACSTGRADWLAQYDSTAEVAHALSKLLPVVDSLVEGLSSGALAHRPPRDALAHVEAILHGCFTEARNGPKALSWHAIARLDLDGRGLDARKGQTFAEDGAKKVAKRVKAYLKREPPRQKPLGKK